MVPLRWLGDSKRRVREFPDSVRSELGHELWQVEIGEDPSDWKPMPSIGIGVREIRVKDQNGAFRVIYVANIDDRVFVLHAFQKKTQKTAAKDIELARARYRELKR
jgi:phage-related protein